MTRRPTIIDDLTRFRTPLDPRLSPDGGRVAYLLKTVDTAKNRYDTQLWLVATQGKDKPRQLTRGDSVSGHHWAPDGQAIGFLRTQNKVTQLWLLPLTGGEAECVTTLGPGAIGDWCFSPDGSQVLFSFRPADETYSEKAIDERKAKNRSTPPRTITRLRWRSEGAGFLPPGTFQLHLLDLASRKVTPLTTSERDYGAFCWSPDGKRIAYTQNVAADPDRLLNANALFVLELGTSEPQRFEPIGPKGNLAWSPDGSQLAYLGHSHPDEFWGVRNIHLWVVDLSAGTARDLMDGWDVTAGDLTLGEVTGRGDVGPVWSADSTALELILSDQGATQLWRLGLDGSRERLDGLGASTVGFSNAAGIQVQLRVTGDAGALYCGPRCLVQPNAELLRKVALPEPISFSATAPDGQAVPCFALLPSTPGPHPTLLYIHGGPHLMYGRWHLFHEYQALAAAGYAVLYPNPRGSKGYGDAWTGAIRDDWGTPAMADCMACVDYALAQGWADPERLGVIGGSYGGYLTAWIVGHTDRFAAAVAERGVYNLQSMGGTTDFPWIDYSYFQSNHTDDTISFQRNSPLTYAAKVTTPLLIIHSEGDLRCPVTQADEYFRAVKQANKAPVEYLRFGVEANHELSRGGPPDLRIVRQQRIHAWFDKYLR